MTSREQELFEIIHQVNRAFNTPLENVPAVTRAQKEALERVRSWCGGHWAWADIGPTVEESPTNPNPGVFSLVWVPADD